jgi:adenylate kinase
MRLIIIGPPGSGKGTQAVLLSQRLGLAHISTGDILREAIAVGTPAGKLAEPLYKYGKLVPDAMVNEMVVERFRRDDRPERFIMDGYPRTLAQAAAFDQLLRQQFLNVLAVPYLTVSDDEIVRRLSGRRICPKPPGCGATYHLVMNPPKKPGICDRCGTALVQRPDDKEETVRHRLQVYHETVPAVIEHYRSQGLLREVSGEGSIEEIYAWLVHALPDDGGSPC